MPSTATGKDQGFTSGNSSGFTSASITPSANSLYLVLFRTLKIGGPPPGVTSISGTNSLNVTYSLATSVAFASNQSAIYAYQAIVTGTSAGTITVAYDATSLGADYQIIQFTSVDTTTPVVQSATGTTTGTTVSATLAAFGSANNSTFGFAAFPGTSSTSTPGSGFTEIYGRSVALAGSEWRNDNDTSVDYSIDFSGSNEWAILALEVKFAAAAAVTTTNLPLLGIGT